MAVRFYLKNQYNNRTDSQNVIFKPFSIYFKINTLFKF